MFTKAFILLAFLASLTAREPTVSRAVDSVQWLPPPSPNVDVREHIVKSLETASEAGHQPLVYVGAKWCEPCQRFKHAVKGGGRPLNLEAITFVEFDLDTHRDGLQVNGYQSRMIPLFCVPDRETGRSTGKCIQGAVKGPGAVGNIVPRLRELLQNR